MLKENDGKLSPSLVGKHQMKRPLTTAPIYLRLAATGENNYLKSASWDNKKG
jgi:hypothetical protein